MRKLLVGALALGLALGGCEDDGTVIVDGEGPPAPRALDARYYAGAVYVTWELASAWNGESFRVYGRRSTDADYFLIAEVTNCSGGLCSYTDVNVVAGQSYDYYVAAVDPDTGAETATVDAVRVDVPVFDPPPVPTGVAVVALDDAAYVTWDDGARAASDFSFYRVYLSSAEGEFLLGETDSEGFLDLLATNGVTSTYMVASVDDQGHESGFSHSAAGTPRPDFHGEWVYDHFSRPGVSGFRFRADEGSDPIVSGTDAARHFRLEEDVDGFWLVPGPDTRVYPQGFVTTALKCGPASDASCTALDVAPGSGYVEEDLFLEAQTTYVLEVVGDDGRIHYGAVRVVMLGFDQGDPLMIFDWAYQLKPGDPSLVTRAGRVPRR